MTYLRLVHLLAAATITLSACGGTPPPQAGVPGAARLVATDYTLGAGDKVRITVFGEERLTGEYNVADGGDIAFPLIGNVRAAGITVDALQVAIRTRLAAGYFKDPRVSAEVLNYRPFYILGEVTKPGQYPYAPGLTVQQAVATAGGFTYRANTRKIFLKHPLDTTEKVIDLRQSAPVPVLPGDTVRVGERYF